MGLIPREHERDDEAVAANVKESGGYPLTTVQPEGGLFSGAPVRCGVCEIIHLRSRLIIPPGLRRCQGNIRSPAGLPRAAGSP